jgi:hypothetical protein
MAFSTAALGGSIASGFLSGVQGARQQREALRAEREKSALDTYTKLIKSGAWRPVDPSKGVAEGGVLKVGDLGFLAPVEQQPDLEKLWKIQNYKSQVESRGRVARGTVRKFDVNIEGPDGKKLPGTQDMVFDGQEWVPIPDKPPVLKTQTPRWPKTYIDPKTGKTYNLEPGMSPKDTWVPFGEYVSGGSYSLRQNRSEAEQYRAEAKEDFDTASKFEGMLAIKSDMDNPNNPITTSKRLWAEKRSDAVGKLAQSQALQDGKDPGTAARIGQKAKEEAQEKFQKLIEQYATEEPDERVTVFTRILEFYNNLPSMTDKEMEEIREKAARMLQQEAIGKSEPVGPPIVRKPMPKRKK